MFKLIAALIEAHINDSPLSTEIGPLARVEVLDGPPA